MGIQIQPENRIKPKPIWLKTDLVRIDSLMVRFWILYMVLVRVYHSD